MQTKLSFEDNYKSLKDYIKAKGVKYPLLVCGKSFFNKPIAKSFDFSHERFSDFTPNPLYEQCIKGEELFRKKGCDMIIAVGGGSAIDVAKCIKYYSKMPVPLVAIPTTAGTGSESTRFAVIYKDGEKQSIDDELCYPDAYVLDYRLLEGLPDNQRIATMLDALSHGIESMWSVNSTEESIAYAKEAISKVLEFKDAYLAKSPDGDKGMLEAANTAGCAINITRTTAGHAMCYKITTCYNIPHGLSAALCIKGLLPFMRDNINKCKDKRGRDYLENILRELSSCFGCADFAQFTDAYRQLMDELCPNTPNPTDSKLQLMVDSVNASRLMNHPIEMTDKDIRAIYEDIFSK